MSPLIQKLGDKLAKGVRNWVLSLDGPRTHASYVRMLNQELSKDIHQHLINDYAERLRTRGIVPASSEKAAIITKRVLWNSKDLHHRLLTAPDPDGITAGAWSLGALLDNQDSVAESFTSQAQDDYEKASFQDSVPDDIDPDNVPDGYVGLTGRRMWNTADDPSRHSDLDGMTATEDETFPVEGTDGWYGPREDPTDAPQSSNCSCFLSFEQIDENGETSWV